MAPCKTIIELFFGAGGSFLGLKRAGFEIGLVIDINVSACKTYTHNHPKTICLNRDITQLPCKEVSTVVKDKEVNAEQNLNGEDSVENKKNLKIS